MAKRKYILGLVGSRRKGGNTDFLVSEVLRAGAELGARTETIYLSEAGIAPCQACNYCRTHSTCRQKDGMQALYPKLRAADAIVLGTPAYFGVATGQTTVFINRLLALYDRNIEPKIKQAKQGAIVFVWAASGAAYARGRKPVVDYLADVLKTTFKAKVIGRVMSGNLAAVGDAAKRPELARQARAIGRKLAS